MNREREKLYDEQVSPLVVALIEKCKELDMPMFLNIQFSKDDFSTTKIGTGGHMVLEMMHALQKCSREQGVNIDAFLAWCMRTYPNHSSVYLNMLGQKPKPNYEPGTQTTNAAGDR